VTDPVTDLVTDVTREPATPTPLLRVVKGDPSPEELAALVSVLAALGGSAESDTRASAPAAWNSPRRLHRVVHPHGPGGWRGSGLPR